MAPINGYVRVNGGAMYVPPGVYELHDTINNPKAPDLCWRKGEKFIVKKNEVKISDRSHEYYTLHRVNGNVIQASSYETDNWNRIAGFLYVVESKNNDIHRFINRLGAAELSGILSILEETGRITRGQIIEAHNEYIDNK